MTGQSSRSSCIAALSRSRSAKRSRAPTCGSGTYVIGLVDPDLAGH